jgi:hypothetical protein
VIGRYAHGTAVPVERSRVEIERVLTKYGASKFGTMTEETRSTVYFEVKGRQLQWSIPMPDAKRMTQSRFDQERRRRWRVMLITLKAMLEAVESKLMTFDEAFLSHIVIPGTARTVAEALSTPKLDALYSGKWRPALLAENPDGKP